MNGTCGCSPVYNDSRFHIYCNVWKKQNPITEIAQFSEWPPHPTQFEVSWCYSLLIIYQKPKQNKKTITKHLTSGSVSHQVGRALL